MLAGILVFYISPPFLSYVYTVHIYLSSSAVSEKVAGTTMVPFRILGYMQEKSRLVLELGESSNQSVRNANWPLAESKMPKLRVTKPSAG